MFFMGYILVLTEELFRFNSISIFLYEMTLTLGFKWCKKANVKGRLAKVKKKKTDKLYCFTGHNVSGFFLMHLL